MRLDDGSAPTWIFLYLCFVTVVSTAFAVVAYLDASVLWSNWAALEAPGAIDLDGPAGLFIARNLGTAALGVYALANRSRAMLEALLVLRIVVDLFDGIHAVIAGNPPVIVIGFAAAAAEVVMLMLVRRRQP